MMYLMTSHVHKAIYRYLEYCRAIDGMNEAKFVPRPFPRISINVSCIRNQSSSLLPKLLAALNLLLTSAVQHPGLLFSVANTLGP